MVNDKEEETEEEIIEDEDVVADEIEENIKKEDKEKIELLKLVKEEEEDRADRFKKITLYDIKQAVELIQFYIEMSEEINQTLNRVAPQGEEDLQNTFLKNFIGKIR